LIVIEVNFITYPGTEIKRLGYSRLYIREVPDTYTGQIQQKYGFRTTTITRPAIIANLVEVVRDHIYLINDSKTLGEMITFIKNERGKPEAQAGKHDDLILGLAIAHHIRGQQEMQLAQEVVEKAPEHFAFRTDDDEGGDYVAW
jgi:phage terminase large subunit